MNVRFNLSRGRSFLYPLETLPVRIATYLNSGITVKIGFRPEGILFHNSGQIIPSTQRFSKNFFQQTSIAEISFRPNIKDPFDGGKRIGLFLRTGDLKHIKPFLGDIVILPPAEQILHDAKPIINTPFELGTIPGEFKHYTDFKMFCAILSEQTIKALGGKKDRTPRLCFTDLNLTPDKVCDYFFSGSQRHANDSRGDYVLGFDLPQRTKRLMEQPKPGSPEYWLRENIKFGDNAELRFAGYNPFALSAVA
ncbi:hypothetical protein A2276_08460 [candidate division WOR-1 bacterium RIFOXYA12_FULL_43_27]|uniref:Uncharacterized protein n=1 Tax=candidate division WOR-1 bacterium RIFOXYC2_FULL_46_14 TaxID=1802587 RepID=A0A1F4U683_UNCSA|nr:MAG: hypothetical protein A2276_08460 [candidate division WOR-1 bacterium RIFOXYA12_FULL_43_27]OGC20623.1 MAG: hypothetical protein A2292_06285 [candidate division WOR-1 bacterium RIFOXYB2_FULL_46_45]OGC31640.1 MAG: hypothetical protein A2232_05165 [candidate division WOR-1 bacterium RIFOXYA2_FULL_46_56]OGC40464.1 MAG: hypothetical protein A2438_04315 [candidate division WOR-1 bacterium RIFOXYC2_FULL_46_14]